MNKQEIKLFLKDNPKYIEDILEELGCKKIKTIMDKRVQSTRPNINGEIHDNPSSIQIKLNNSLSTSIKTDNKFDNEEFKDVFGLIQYLLNINFNEAINYVCNICGLKYNTSTRKDTRVSDTYNILKQIKKSKGIMLNFDEEILPEYFKERFIRQDCELFFKDRVYSSTQDKFWISYDTLDNRVVFPIRNYNGEIISFKGRSNDKQYKEKGIPKFIYYYPCDSRNYLYGYYENYFDIVSNEEIYIGEAEKFVHQLDSMGINNALAISKKNISFEQLNQLIKLHKKIVLAFDKDVILEDIFIECRKFRNLCDVYYIYDKDNILKAKESPTDKGFEVWNELTTKYKFKYKGE